jgi:hypothetical protein
VGVKSPGGEKPRFIELLRINRKKGEYKMRGIIVRWIMLTAAIMFASYIIEGIHVRGFFSALFAAAMLRSFYICHKCHVT